MTADAYRPARKRIQLCRLFEKARWDGGRHFVGRCGFGQFILELEYPPGEHKTRDPSWILWFAESDGLDQLKRKRDGDER